MEIINEKREYERNARMNEMAFALQQFKDKVELQETEIKQMKQRENVAITQ